MSELKKLNNGIFRLSLRKSVPFLSPSQPLSLFLSNSFFCVSDRLLLNRISFWLFRSCRQNASFEQFWQMCVGLMEGQFY
jgi:hypothetical protein